MFVQWMRDLGFPITASADVASALVAIMMIFGATAIGALIAFGLRLPLSHRVQALGGRLISVTPRQMAAIVFYAITALFLAIASQIGELSWLGRTVLAVGSALSVGLLVFQLLAAMRFDRAIIVGLSVLAVVVAALALFVGLDPLARRLDGVGFDVGARRFSLLAAINAVVTIAVIYLVARATYQILIGLLGRSSALDPSQRVLVQKLAGIAVVVVAVLLGIDLLGVDLTALTVFSGAAGLAVGFGLQKTLGNLIAGLILLMDRSIKPGDVIVVGDTFGAVSKIGVRAVSVVTRDGKEHLIPNEQLMTEPVENWSYSSRNVRVHIPVGVSYGCDLALAQKLMIEAATAAERVLDDPKPSVWLKAFGDSSVDHDILIWIVDPELGVGNIRSDILNRIWALFKENDIEIPFPQRDLHIRSMPPAG